MADRIEGLSIGLDLDTVQLERGLTGLKDRMRSVNSEMKANMSAFDRGDKSISKYETRLQGLNKKLEVQKRVTQEAQANYERMVQEHGEGSKQAEKAAREYNNQAASLNNLERYVNNATSELEQMRKEAQANESAWGKLGKTMQEQGSRVSRVGKGITKVGATWTKVTAGIAGAATGAAASVFAFTNKVTENADAIAKGSERVGVATDTYQVLDYWASQNGLSHERMEKAVGRFNQRLGQAQNGNEKYSDALQQLGVDMQAVEEGTLSTDEAFTQSIQKLSEMENEQDKINLATEMFGTRMARDLLPALNEGSLSFEEAQQKAEEYGLVMSQDQLEQAEAFQDAQDDIKRSLSAVGMSIGLELMPHFQKMLDWIRGNLPQIRETLTGAFDRVAEIVSNLITWFRDLSPVAKTLMGVFAGLAAALGPILMVGGQFISMIGGIMTAMGPVMTAIAKAGGLLNVLKLAFAALTGPVGLTIAGITALTAGFVTAYAKSETFRDIIQSVKDAFINAYESVKEFLTTNETLHNFLDGVKQTFQNIKQSIENAIGAVVDFVSDKITEMKLFWDTNGAQILQAFENIWSGIRTVVESVLDIILGIVRRVLPIIKDVFEDVFNTLLSIAENIWEGIKGVVNGALEAIKGFIQLFSGIFTGDFEQMWNGIQNIFQGALEIIESLVGTVFESIRDIVSTIMDAVGNIISAGWSYVRDKATEYATAMWDGIRNTFNNLKEGVINLTTSAKDGIINQWNNIKSSVTNLAKELWEAVKRRFDDMVDGARELPGRIGDGISNMADKALDGIKKLANSMGSTLEDGINGVIKGLNGVLELLGVDEGIKEIAIPKLKRGTNYHQGGPAIVGDGGMSELIRTPNGREYLSPDRDTLVNMPKGTQVLSGPDTKKLLPMYQDGTTGLRGWLSGAWGTVKDVGGFVKDKATDFMTWAFEGGKKVIEKLVDASGFTLPAGNEFFSRFARGGWNTVMDALANIFDDKKPESGFTGTGSSEDVSRWIAQAIGITGVPKSWQGALETIAMHESGGDPSIVNTWDINARRGTPSIGLMQTIGPTFDAHKLPGMNDIRNPVHNAVAAIRYIQSRYGNVYNTPGIKSMANGGPYKGYADGGKVGHTQWALVGEEGPELVRLPGGSEVLTHEESVNALSKRPQYSAERLTESIMDIVKEGIKQAESIADVDVMSLINQGVTSAWENSPARSNIRKIRDIRESNIKLLEEEIARLKEQAETEEDINLLNEKQAELNDLRAKKAVEYQNKIRDEKALLEAIEQAHQDGLITQSQYNQASAEMTIRINDLTKEADDFNRKIGEEQQRAIEQSKERMKEYAQEASEAFSQMADEHQNAYETAMNKQEQDLQDTHDKAIETFEEETESRLTELKKQEQAAMDSFDRVTNKHEESVNKQIDAIRRRRDEEVQAIQDQLDAMDKEDQRNEREDQEQAWSEEMARLERRLTIADFMNDENTRQSVLGEISDLEEQIADQRRDWERADRRESLRNEQDRIKQEYEARIEEREDELQDYLSRREAQRDHLENRYQQRREAYEAERQLQLESIRREQEQEREAFQQDFQRQQERFNLLEEKLAEHVQQGLLTQEEANAIWLQAIEDLGNEQVLKEIENQERSKEALNEYVEDYLNIGKSYGNNLIDGLVGTLKDRLSDVTSAVSSITSAVSSGGSSSSDSAPRGGGWTIPSDPNHDSRTGIERVRDRLKERMKKFHDGGWVGMPKLSADEIPAILQRGEFVLSRDMISSLQRIGNMIDNMQQPQPIHIYLDGEEMTDVIMTRATRTIEVTSRKGG